MDNENKSPYKTGFNFSKKIVPVVVLLILILGIFYFIYYFSPQIKNLNLSPESTYQKKINNLEALRVTPNNGEKELTTDEKTAILKSLRVKSVSSKDAKVLTPVEQEAILNSVK